VPEVGFIFVEGSDWAGLERVGVVEGGELEGFSGVGVRDSGAGGCECRVFELSFE
jgi:hypothetical protein